MNVRAANVNVSNGADAARSQESQQAGHGKAGKEADCGKEKAAFGAIGNVLMKKLTHARNVQKQEDSGGGG